MIRNRQGSCPTGDAVITTAGKLKAQWVVHAVGPVWNGGNKQEEHLLISAYQKALELAEEKQASSISFPAISTGIYRFPKERACELAITTISKYFCDSIDSTIREVRFVLFDLESFHIYKSYLDQNLLNHQ